MAKLDSGRLIEEARELIIMSRYLCEDSRCAKNASIRLQDRVVMNFAPNRRAVASTKVNANQSAKDR